jgi:glycerol-3-phosphate cytidylyltransferase
MTEGQALGEIRTGLIGWIPMKKGARILYAGEDESFAAFLHGISNRVETVSIRELADITGVDAATDLTDESAVLDIKDASPDNGNIGGKSDSRAVVTPHGYDFVISIATPELFRDASAILRFFSDCCCEDGMLILGMNNRYGVRYFCGDRDPYTERTFDGITDYQTEYRRSGVPFRGRMYGRGELGEMLSAAGWDREDQHFFAVLPGLEYPAFLYAEGYQPNEAVSGRTFGVYHSPDTVFLQEAPLYNGLLDNGLFYQTANAYLILCSRSKQVRISDILQVTSSMERGHENALYTILTKKCVIKQAAFSEGTVRLQELDRNMRRIQARGISVVKEKLTNSEVLYNYADNTIYSKSSIIQTDCQMENAALIMPFVNAPTSVSAFHQLDPSDMHSFYRMLDDFIDILRKSSDQVKVKQEMIQETTERLHGLGMDPKAAQRCGWLLEQGPVLEHGYLDMKLLNSFYEDGHYLFIDQELDFPNLPLSVLVFQAVRDALEAFRGTPDRNEVLNHYGFTQETAAQNGVFCDCLINSLRRQDRLPKFRRTHMIRPDVQNANLRRSNFSYEEYNERFLDIFGGSRGKELVLFGAGMYARNFLELYGDTHPVSLIIDNSPNRKKELGGIPITSAEALKELKPGSFKVIVCIRDCIPVLRQLGEMGIHDASVFDPAIMVPESLTGNLEKTDTSGQSDGNDTQCTGQKKYHIGYIAGVFDLFHVGHVNLLRRAKEQCDYLIVGVVSDEGVQRGKNTKTVIPCEQRMEVLKACRYVDQVVKLPLDFADTDTMWKKFHFDVQFSGSDYEYEPTWQRKKEFLETHGAELVFFPYTQSTSTTKIKKELSGKN